MVRVAGRGPLRRRGRRCMLREPPRATLTRRTRLTSLKIVKFPNLLGVPLLTPATAAANGSSTGDAAPPVPATPGLMRTLNNRVVLDLLVRHSTLSRGDVCRMTGLSKPTASQLLTRLEGGGLVLDAGVGTARPGGRAPQMYRLNPRAGFAAAINVEPSTIHVRVADLVGTTIAETTQPTDDGDEPSGPARAIQALRATVRQAGIGLTDLSATVIGAPGSYDPVNDQLRFSDHLHDWQQGGLIARLASEIPGAVTVENDVNLAAVAERQARDGGADNFVLLWLDERIGGAIVIDGRLYRGSRGAAGEAAFLQLPGVPVVRNPARDNHGGFDDLAGQSVIMSMAAEAGIEGPDAATVMAALVAADTENTRAILTEIASRYATALASMLALLDPAQVILAGAIVAAGGTALVDAVASELAAVAIVTPPVTAGIVTNSPITRGAMILSLGLARERVFST